MLVLNLPRSLCGTETQIPIEDFAKDEVTQIIFHLTGFLENDFYLLHNGKKFNPETYTDGVIYVVPRLLGGKGGFGSMLRAIGAQIEKTTNREACRDLSGRRLRDINEERRLKNWLAQKEEREKEAKERKRKKIERMLQEPKIEIKDEEYNQQRSMLTENISDSVELGLKVAESSGVKRKSEDEPSTSKKPKKGGLLFDMDFEIDSDAEISSCDSDEETPGPSGISGASESNSGSSSNKKSDDEESSEAGTVENNETKVATGCSKN